jgi:hypothetical protein
MERIGRHFFERRQQPEIGRLHPMQQGAAPPANRAITDTDMVEVGIDREFDAPAVA